MRKLVIAVTMSLAGPALAQNAQCPCTYTLSQEQRQLLQSMHSSAVLWAVIRGASARGTLDADAYDALRADYDAVMAQIVKQGPGGGEEAQRRKRKPRRSAAGAVKSIFIEPGLLRGQRVQRRAARPY